MSQSMRIVGVVGARPNFMKIAPLMSCFGREPERYDFTLVHTGQHYDERLSEIFFDELDLPRPEIHLGVGSASHADQTARVMTAFEKVLLEREPHLVIVVGDVNSTLACALTAAKLKIALAHVEAGLRSRDRRMPEEINRIVTDALSDLLFTTSRHADINLLAEGAHPSRICLVGNIMIDTLIRLLDKAAARPVMGTLGLKPGSYGLVTLHRPSNVDQARTLGEIVGALARISDRLPLVFPVHPRTVKMLDKFGLGDRVRKAPGMTVLEPLGYLDFLSLMRSARLVISDSGGIQEETTFLGVPCLTMRENTERPETIEQGTNLLVGSDGQLLYKEALRIIDGQGKKGGKLEFWDGKVAERIIEEINRRRDRLTSPPDVRLSQWL